MRCRLIIRSCVFHRKALGLKDIKPETYCQIPPLAIMRWQRKPQVQAPFLSNLQATPLITRWHRLASRPEDLCQTHPLPSCHGIYFHESRKLFWNTCDAVLSYDRAFHRKALGLKRLIKAGPLPLPSCDGMESRGACEGFIRIHPSSPRNGIGMGPKEIPSMPRSTWKWSRSILQCLAPCFHAMS